MKYFTGQIIKTEQRLYDNVINQWQIPLTFLNSVIEAFNELPNLIGPFNNETYFDVAYRGGKNTFTAFTKAIEEDTCKRIGPFAAKVLLSNDIEQLYQPLKKYIAEFNKSIEAQNAFTPLLIDDIEIKDGKPILLIDKILERFQYRLENVTQAAMYDLLVKAISIYNEANTYLLTVAQPFDLPLLHGNYGLFFEDKNGFLGINYGNINRINEQPELIKNETDGTDEKHNMVAA